MTKGIILYASGEFVVQFDRAFMAANKEEYYVYIENIRKLSQHRFDPVKSCWLVPVYAAAVDCIQKLINWGLNPTKNARIAISAELEKAAKTEAAAAAAVEQIVTIPKLGALGEAMKNYQRQGVLFGERTKRTYIGDEMGLGKSLQGLGCLEINNAYPAAILCPPKLKQNWVKEVKRWLPHRSVSMNHRQLAEISVLSYTEIHNLVRMSKAKGEGSRNWYPDVVKLNGILADESHYIKEAKSRRSTAAINLANDCASPVRVCLSGTPVENRPRELISPMTFLGVIHHFGGVQSFERRYCAARRRKMGDRYIWDNGGASNSKELHELMSKVFYIRRKKADVLKELPPRIDTVMECEISNEDEYRSIERDVVAYLIERNNHLLSDNAMDAKHLIKLGRLRNAVGRGKVDWIVDWVNDFLESDEKFILYAVHKETQELLRQKLAHWNPAVVYADCKNVAAEEKKFAEDKSCRLFLGSVQAAGFGLTLTTASHIGLAELMWVQTKHQQVFDRAHRIGQQRCVNAYYFLAPRTIDDDMWEALSEKTKIVTALTDGEDLPQSAVLTNIVRKMLTRN